MIINRSDIAHKGSIPATMRRGLGHLRVARAMPTSRRELALSIERSKARANIASIRRITTSILKLSAASVTLNQAPKHSATGDGTNLDFERLESANLKKR